MIIGISGFMGSGKSTLANILKEEYEGKAMVLPFAKAVKDIALKMGWNGKKDEKGRKLLQLIGTECGRNCIDQNIWVKHWEEQLRLYPDVTLFIADDVRFANEVSCITRYEGINIRIKGRGKAGSHVSEKPLTDKIFDYVIHNEYGLEELDQLASQLIAEGIFND